MSDHRARTQSTDDRNSPESRDYFMDAGYWTATPVTSMRVSLITTQFTSDHFGSNRLMCSYGAPVLSAFVSGLRLSSPLQALWIL
jgi:hypothetical protein